MTPERRQAYWQANLKLLYVLLTVWFVVSFGCGIFLKEALDGIQIGGYKLVQSEVCHVADKPRVPGRLIGPAHDAERHIRLAVFLVLIALYANRMNKLDKEFDVHED